MLFLPAFTATISFKRRKVQRRTYKYVLRFSLISPYQCDVRL